MSQPHLTPKTAFEIHRVHNLEVACDGGDGPLGHPRVFLHIDRAIGSVTCPYCSVSYVYDEAGYH